MRHEPGGAVGAEAEHAPKLVRGDRLFRGAHKVRREEPLMQRDMAALVQSADRRRKRLPAVLALVDARAGALAFHFGCVADGAAMRADRAIGPAQRLEVLPGFFFVVEYRASQVHGVTY
jgi:anti-sigma factor RsiW